MNNIEIRPIRDKDGEIAGMIFFDAVHKGTSAHYTHEQRAAWAGDRPNPSAWRKRLAGVEGFIAEVDGLPVGFMTIDSDGYIDLAFVLAEAAGKGIGWGMYKAVEERAKQLGLIRLTTEASKTARPFFARQGWNVDQEQVIEKRGVPLTNYKMSKTLPAR